VYIEETKMNLIGKLKNWANKLKTEVRILYLAFRDPDTPIYAKVWAGAVVAYAISPIDLIPDFVPVLGYLDDLILLPLGVWVATRMIPPAVYQKCRIEAEKPFEYSGAIKWIFSLVIVVFWGCTAVVFGIFIWKLFC